MRQLLISILVIAVTFSSAEQRPFEMADPGPKWRIRPTEDETGHLIFNAASSWLQHWPNTRWRNGHSIVPGYIAPGTLLYHGNISPNVPKGPNWVSFDFEHSYLFGTVMQTFAVKGPGRGLRVIYLDGSSASNMRSGTMDIQELLARGEIIPKEWQREGDHIRGMCEWGKPYGVQGIIRMEYDFEVMICDFSVGLERLSVVDALPRYRPPLPSSSFSNNPWNPPIETPPIGWKGPLRHIQSVLFEAIQGGVWHDFVPGVPGVELDYSSAISFFDPKYTSLVEARRRTPRRENYRPGNISRSDLSVVEKDLQSVLQRDPSRYGSGVKWADILRSVKERYTQRIESLSYILRPSRSALNVTDAASQARRQVLVMLSPFLEDKPITAGLDAWLEEPMERCASQVTEPLRAEWLTPQEILLKRSIEVVLKEICRTLGAIWEEAFDIESKFPEDLTVLVRGWRSSVDNLQEWLGWAEWIKCDPPCGPTEMCSMPQWPFDMGRVDDLPDECEDLYTPYCMDRTVADVPVSECKIRNLPKGPLQ